MWKPPSNYLCGLPAPVPADDKDFASLGSGGPVGVGAVTQRPKIASSPVTPVSKPTFQGPDPEGAMAGDKAVDFPKIVLWAIAFQAYSSTPRRKVTPADFLGRVLPVFIVFYRLIGTRGLKLVLGIYFHKISFGSGKNFAVNIKPERGRIKRTCRDSCLSS